jgi:hypothetical protein
MMMFGYVTTTRLTINKLSDSEEQVDLENQQPDGSFKPVMHAIRIRS